MPLKTALKNIWKTNLNFWEASSKVILGLLYPKKPNDKQSLHSCVGGRNNSMHTLNSCSKFQLATDSFPKNGVTKRPVY